MNARGAPTSNHARRMRLLQTCFVLLVLLVVLPGCSHLQGLSTGPTFNLADDRALRGPGAAVMAETAGGSTSSGDVFTGVGVGARGAVTEHAVDLSPFVGPDLGGSVGRFYVGGGMRLGPGLQIYDGRALGFLLLGASLGVGYALTDTGWMTRGRFSNPWGIEGRPRGQMPIGGPDMLTLEQNLEAQREREETRRRVLVTFGVGADVESRFTRSPMLSLSALVGVSWMDEVK